MPTDSQCVDAGSAHKAELHSLCSHAASSQPSALNPQLFSTPQMVEQPLTTTVCSGDLDGVRLRLGTTYSGSRTHRCPQLGLSKDLGSETKAELPSTWARRDSWNPCHVPSLAMAMDLWDTETLAIQGSAAK